jgi:hypothetical protein
MEERSYKKDLEVDKNELDVEWEKQTRLYLYWAEREADAQEERDMAIRALNVIKAQLDAQIRSDPEKYGIVKFSESAVNHAIMLSPKFEQAEKNVISSTKNARILAGVMKDFEHKKRALTELDSLWVNGYYSATKPKGVRERQEVNRQTAAEEKIGKNPRLLKRR